MNKPTVESINLVYADKFEKYAAMMVVDAICDLKYIVLEEGKYKDTVMKYAQETAERLGVEFIDEVKEDVVISGGGGGTVEDIDNLKDGESLDFDTYSIERAFEEHRINGQRVRMYFVDLYTVTDSFGYQGESADAEEIVDAINCGVFG